MIHIQYYRVAVFVVAATVRGNQDIDWAWGFTKWGAEKRLVNRLIKE